MYLFELVATGMKDIDLVKNEFKKMFRLKFKIEKNNEKDRARFKDFFSFKEQNRINHEVLTKI
jgi:hypothetical protein